jgi:hypothetical protein
MKHRRHQMNWRFPAPIGSSAPILSLFLLLFTSTVGYSQADRPFGDRLIIGTSVTYIWENNKAVTRNMHHEITWDKNIAVSLTRSLYFGLSHKSIFTRGSSFFDDKNNRERYSVAGAFAQYDLIQQNQKRLFVELSYHIGDYCTCGYQTDPYRRNRLRYLGMGGGIDLPIWKSISLDLAFIHHNILNRVPQKYGYNLYVVGLNYNLVRSSR